jgi:hypothetical protein
LRPHVTAAKCFYEKLQNENQKIRKIGRTMKTAPFQHLQIRSIAPFPPPDILARSREKSRGFCRAFPLIFIGKEKIPLFTFLVRTKSPLSRLLPALVRPSTAPAKTAPFLPSMSLLRYPSFYLFCYNLGGI